MLLEQNSLGWPRNLFRCDTPPGRFVLGWVLASAMFAPLNNAQARTKEKVLYSFCSQANCADGDSTEAGLIMDGAGNLYGTTEYGGGTGCQHGCGAVFKVTPKGKETVLYSFCSQANCTDGAEPVASLISDSGRDLYGTTIVGGADGAGTVFKLTPSGQETVVYSFCSKTNCTDGSQPQAAVITDGAGNFYGTTMEGGKGTACGGGGHPCGTVFKLTPGGSETVLYSFKGGRDGEYPEAGLIMDGAGNLYGTTSSGGATNDGTVFEVTAQGKETVLYSFCSLTGCADGGAPLAGLIADSSGNLYGTTWLGGTVNGNCSGGCGVVFELAPAAQGTPKAKETVLYSFAGGSDGSNPLAGLISDGSGNLYGTTEGTEGGTNGYGTVFEVTSNGQETVLYSFCSKANCIDGAEPDAGLISNSAGNLYGTTRTGGNASCNGALGCGVVFKVTRK